MISDATMRQHLSGYLAPAGVEFQDLLGEVDTALGTPLLVVAAGSVLHGLGNRTSAIDLHVIDGNARVTDLPIPSRTLGVTVDVNYIDGADVRAAARKMGVAADDDGSGTPSDDTGWSSPRTRTQWRAARRRLTQLGRLALGLPLDGDPPWRDWQAGIRLGIVRYTERWWRTETLRYRSVGELLRSTNPLTAAHRYSDAGLAALDAHATAAGQAYVGPKWVGVKLERLGRKDLIDHYHRLLDTPLSAAGCDRYLAEVDEILAELSAGWHLPDDPVVTLTPADGLTAWTAHGDRGLLHRWGLRGVEGPRSWVDPIGSPDWSWSGRLSEMDDELRLLCRGDLVWITAQEDVP